MSPFALIGTLSLVASLVAVIVYGFIERLPYLKAPWNYGHNSYLNISTFPLFFGVTAFLFNTHTMVLPIEQSLKNRRWYSLTLHSAFIFVTLMNLIFAVLTFMFFGNSIEDNAAKNLPNNVFVYIVKGTLCAELLLTFAIVMMPVSETFDEQVLHSQKKHKWRFLILSTVIRSLLVLLIIGIAEAFGNKFGIVMGFIGGISPNALGFIIPPLFFLRIMRRHVGWLEFVFNCTIIVFGVLAMITSTWVVIQQL
jgi:amino acid permease